MAFKDYVEIVDKCCDAWNDILKKDNFVKKLCSREWIELVQFIFENGITYDNGKEFSGHEQVNKTINCKSYFAKVYHSWERGQNENANGLLRQYFPKTMSLVNVACNEVKIAVPKSKNRTTQPKKYQSKS